MSSIRIDRKPINIDSYGLDDCFSDLYVGLFAADETGSEAGLS